MPAVSEVALMLLRYLFAVRCVVIAVAMAASIVASGDLHSKLEGKLGS